MHNWPNFLNESYEVSSRVHLEVCMHVIFEGRYETDLQPFERKRTGKWLWAKQALQAKEKRPWGLNPKRKRETK